MYSYVWYVQLNSTYLLIYLPVLFDKIASAHFISKIFQRMKWPAQGTRTVPIGTLPPRISDVAKKIQISQYNLVMPDLGPAPVLVVETVVVVTERSVQHQSFFRSARHLAHCQATCRRIGARNYLAAYKWHSGVTVDNNTDNDNHDNVYGAVVMTEVIARVHQVDLMNVDWAPGGRQPSDQANWLGLWVYQKLAAIIYIHHRRYYY